MKVDNVTVAKIFNQVADLLEIEGANPFRVRAYRNAAQFISGLSKNVADLVAEGEDLTQLPHIGEDLAGKIQTIVKTGKLPALKEIEKRVPPVLSHLLQLEGLGPKRVQMLYQKLHVRNVTDLKQAIHAGKVRKIKGFGEKMEEKIKESIQRGKHSAQRYQLAAARIIAMPLLAYLKNAPGIVRLEIAGSYRRQEKTVGDLDIVASAKSGVNVICYFVRYPEISDIISQGTTRATVRLKSGIQVDLRVVLPASFGAALLYFTGSKAHSIALRKIALAKKLKLNEYGLFRGKTCIASKTEQAIYEKLGLQYRSPELRS